MSSQATDMPHDVPPAGSTGTEAEQLREALRDAKARFEKISALTSYWLWQQDRDFRFSRVWGLKSARVHGARDSYLGKTRWELANMETDPAFWQRHREQLERHEPLRQFEFRRQAGNGRVRTYSISGDPMFDAGGQFIGYQGHGSDITEQRHAEAALRASEERFRSLAQMGSDWYWEQDEHFRFVDMSAGIGQRMGITAQTHLGKTRWEVGWVEMDETTWQRHREQLQRHESFKDFVLRRPDDGGLVRHYMISGEPLFDRSGRFSGYRGVGTDITSQVRAEQARHQLEAQLRQSQKMESVGTLAGGIAHDFNNILGAILGNLALAREEIGSPHAAQPLLEQAHRSALRACSLVRQILTFSRREPQHLKSQAMQPVVHETITLLRATMPASVALELALAAAPIHVRADATQLQQVMLNLCTNAWHAANGAVAQIRVGLDSTLLDAESARRLGLSGAGAYAHLSVSDQGQGMDEATRERIFEPFFTTKPPGQGTGLGLAVVHGIVSSHHGAIAVTSAAGQGSTFDLYFPLAEAESSAVPEVDQTTAIAAQTGEGRHVVVIDDDEVMLLLVQSLLQRAGYHVSPYANAHDAVAAVRAAPHSVDAVITDFNMPGLSGLDVARALAEIRPQLPVMISSGNVTETLRQGALQLGVRCLMHKESSYDEVVALVHGLFKT